MILIVTGYGPVLSPEMAKRLEKTVRFCNQHQPGVIIFTGGYTQASVRKSEAGMMFDYVQPRLNYNPAILLEKEAQTTLENFKFSRAYLDSFPGWKNQKIVVDCEVTRRASAILLTLLYCRKLAGVHTHSWMPKYLGIYEIAMLGWNIVQLTTPFSARRMRVSRLKRAERT